MSLRDAFESLLSKHHRVMTLTRGANPPITVQASPSNYSRNLAGPGDTAIEGREFVIPRSQLTGIYLPLRRGDYLTDPEMGKMSIEEINEMYDFGAGAKIMGYRVRTN